MTNNPVELVEPAQEVECPLIPVQICTLWLLYYFCRSLTYEQYYVYALYNKDCLQVEFFFNWVFHAAPNVLLTWLCKFYPVTITTHIKRTGRKNKGREIETMQSSSRSQPSTAVIKHALNQHIPQQILVAYLYNNANYLLPVQCLITCQCPVWPIAKGFDLYVIFNVC